ncbi:MAG: hypothetical protein R6V57_13255 [Vicinamibacterales bacterium]
MRGGQFRVVDNGPGQHDAVRDDDDLVLVRPHVRRKQRLQYDVAERVAKPDPVAGLERARVGQDRRRLGLQVLFAGDDAPQSVVIVRFAGSNRTRRPVS